MPPMEGGLVLIGGGRSSGTFDVERLNKVGSEDIKVVCNGENGRRMETRFTIWFYEIVSLAATYWQKAWAVVYSFLLFFCKSILVAPAARRLNPERFVYLQFVVGMIFARVQVATLPYIDGYWTLIFLMLPKAMALLFRFYAWSKVLASSVF